MRAVLTRMAYVLRLLLLCPSVFGVSVYPVFVFIVFCACVGFVCVKCVCGLVLRLRRGLCCWLLVVVECSPLPDIPARALPPPPVGCALGSFPPYLRRAGPALWRLASSAVDDGGDRR